MGCCVSQPDERTFVSVNQNPNHPVPNPNAVARNAEDRPRRQQNQSSNNPPASQNNQATAQIGRITYLQNPNVEKVIAGQVAGEGIKKTPAYETPLTSHELEKWRTEFWETRTQGHSHIWQLLRNSCSETHDTAEALILATGLTMPQNSLTLVIDENGVYYRVPICCINEPLNYSVNYQDEKLKGKAKPAEKIFQSLKVRSPKGDAIFQITNLEGVKSFKQKYIDKIQDKDLKIENIRMFCLGKELKDELFLYSYDLVDEMTVQVMFKRT